MCHCEACRSALQRDGLTLELFDTLIKSEQRAEQEEQDVDIEGGSPPHLPPARTSGSPAAAESNETTTAATLFQNMHGSEQQRGVMEELSERAFQESFTPLQQRE